MLTRKTILTIVIVVSTCWATPANALYPPPDATCDALPGLTGQVAPDTVPPEPAYKPGGLLVRFAPKANGKQRSKAEKEAFLASIGAGSIKRPYHLVPGLTHVKLPGGLTVDNALKRFKGRREILYAEPNYEVYALATPNDPNFSDQWGMHNTGQTGGTSDADIDAPEAWDLETDANEIVVAVIDTGVDYNHPDLTANMWTDANGCHGYDFVNDDNDPMDDHFHGTHCAGIIGAVGDNNTGVTGVCWNVKIMALKFLDDEASGTTANAIAAIEYAVDNGGDVLSNSWGGTYYSQPLKDAIEAADANSLLFVAAAGNDSMNNDILPVYPSCYDCNNIIAVMSTDHNDEKSSFSNYGPTSVDLGAPGTDILSTFPTYVTSAMQSAGFSTYYETISGTSMAAPHLAGACALAWSEHPTLTHLEIKDILSQWTDELEALDGLCVSNGRLNLYAAVGNKKVNNLSQRKWYDKIQDAIDEANDLDIIRVWPATYYETIDFNQVAVTVRSYNPENPDLVADTIIDGNNSDANIVTFRSSANSILAGFTITGGARGIYCSESSPTIDNCVIEDNNHCGVYGYNSTAAVIRNNQIRQNTYYGVYLAYSSATVKNNWIYDNGSYGIDTYDSGLTVIRNNTIVGNSTAGVYVAHGNEPNIANCILWNNNDDLYNCSATYSCIQDGDSGTGNISSDPCFVDADANDFHLDINSPCINTGDPNGDYTAEKDIDGHPRVMAATVDMGADEFSRIFNLEQEKWYDNIQDAIDDANRNENETIEVGPNRYYENIDFNGVPCILTGVDPNDWAVVAATIIDANGSGTVVTFDSNEDANSVLAGFTITGGADKYSIGGGVYCYQTSPTITHCLITGNSAEKGGGIGTKENQSAVNVAHCNFTGNSAETGGGMYVRYGSATLTDCNLTYNRAEYMGGGFRNSRGSVTFANCAVRSNLSEYGGGVYTGGYATFEASNCTFKNNVADWDEGGGLYNAGALTASNCTFEDNRAVCPGYGFGGAVANNGESGGHANITGCYFSQNQAARRGGGICNYDNGTTTITNCSFEENSCPWDGGAICTYQAATTITNCTFKDNRAFIPVFNDAWGGAIMNEEADVNITNCHFSENQADSGGAIFNYYYSEPNVLNCTFRKNTAEFYGGGMRNLWDSHPTVTNCIFWDNTAGSSGDQIYNSGNSGATVTYCDVQGGWGDPNDPNNTNINVDPCFVSAQADDYHLKSDSPCIDAGDPNGDYTDQRDLDGAYRVVGSPNNPGDPNAVIDMGADEQDCFPSGYSTHDDWVEMDRPDCWCASEISPGYQCDGDADGETSGFPDYYRVYTGDNSLLTNNWKKKIDDPSLDPCADMDHKSSGFPYNYRVYTGDLNRLIVNWKKKDADLPGNCPRSE